MGQEVAELRGNNARLRDRVRQLEMGQEKDKQELAAKENHIE